MANRTAMASTLLVTLNNPHSRSAEAFRQLRTSIMSCDPSSSIRTLLAISPDSLVGQTTTISNLAVVIAQANQRVIIVDNNVLHPTLHILFGLPNDKGLTSLTENADIPLPIQQTEVPGIAILTIGSLSPQSSNIFSPERIRVILLQLQQYADVILFDAPPINNFIYTSSLATQVDGVLLVFRAGKTKGRHARKARQLLDRVNANILGAVLTNVDDETDYVEGERVINQTISFNFGVQGMSC